MRRLLQRLALYAFHVLFVRPLLLLVAGVRYRRLQVVPEGPCLVVANHNSHLDAAVLMTMFPLRRLPHVHPVAAADYFGASWWKRALALLFMNGITIERRPAKGEDPLAPLVEHLKAGESLIFFPEGSRGEAGVVAPFRRGVGLLVQELPGLLVLPVFLSGPERIWPRGQFVPVPLTIYANIGRPRAYPEHEDAKIIAEHVRENVLALAPPPPPMPDDRPVPPTRIVLCSIDGELRSEAFRCVTERLGLTERTLGVADPVLEADADGVREATGPIPVQRLRHWLKMMSWVFLTSRRFRRDDFINLVERAQLDEALNHGQDTRFVVVEHSALIDLVAFQGAAPDRGGLDEAGIHRMTQYLTGEKQIPVGSTWWFLRKAPETWLINTFDLVRPPIPDVLVHLKAASHEVMARLRSRGVKLRPYENVPFLDNLRDAYHAIGVVMRKRRKVEFIELEGDPTAPSEVAERIESLCRAMRGAAGAGP